ncbi:hypothetical protein [Pseudoalteromonas sp. J010]|uniref:hypothetical protein n=1 Tax=Pseudoalteromonas sp. J010 TaxID=998465 RepID=UPI000F650D28|nr:hypothetical protein [Pseudoalteromonas sp. J010]
MPKDIVTELVEAMAVNDSKRIKAVFSQEATQEYKRWWARKKQGDDFKKWLQSDIIDVHGRVLNPKLEVNDNQVIVTGTYVNNDNYKSTANFLFVVKEGKIVSWTIRY